MERCCAFCTWEETERATAAAVIQALRRTTRGVIEVRRRPGFTDEVLAVKREVVAPSHETRVPARV